MAPQLSVEFLTEFIALYKSFPCLWKIKSKEYSNKHLKDEAYQKLIELCRTVVPNADKGFVIKKISSLRGAFKKELKKSKALKSGMSSEDTYEPQLWYYKLLLFTADQETPRTTINSVDTDDSGDGTITIPEPTLEETETEDSQLRVDDAEHTNGSKKRKRNQKDALLEKVAKEVLKDDDEFANFGNTIAHKLRKMETNQRLFCEQIINRTLFLAAMGRLTEYSEVITSNYTQQFPPYNYEMSQAHHFIPNSTYHPTQPSYSYCSPQTQTLPSNCASTYSSLAACTSKTSSHFPPEQETTQQNETEQSSHTTSTPTVSPGTFIPLHTAGRGSTFQIWNDTLQTNKK